MQSHPKNKQNTNLDVQQESKNIVERELEQLGLFHSANKNYWRFALVLGVLAIGGFLLGSLAVIVNQNIRTQLGYTPRTITADLSVNTSNNNPSTRQTNFSTASQSNGRENSFDYVLCSQNPRGARPPVNSLAVVNTPTSVKATPAGQSSITGTPVTSESDVQSAPVTPKSPSSVAQVSNENLKQDPNQIIAYHKIGSYLVYERADGGIIAIRVGR